MNYNKDFSKNSFHFEIKTVLIILFSMFVFVVINIFSPFLLSNYNILRLIKYDFTHIDNFFSSVVCFVHLLFVDLNDIHVYIFSLL